MSVMIPRVVTLSEEALHIIIITYLAVVVDMYQESDGSSGSS